MQVYRDNILKLIPENIHYEYSEVRTLKMLLEATCLYLRKHIRVTEKENRSEWGSYQKNNQYRCFSEDTWVWFFDANKIMLGISRSLLYI